jgi:outer membrane autotransporter protein
VLTNAGTIDMTNGNNLPGDSLTINGDLISYNGVIKMLTVLNAGGDLNNQFTDRLKINGSASSGTIILEVMPTATSTGALTNLRKSSVMHPDEGISLVQIAGDASVNRVTLKGGYLAAGPWRYDLYSFAPGQSDPNQRQVTGLNNTARQQQFPRALDNNFWDYRIGNLYICQNVNCNAPLPPEVISDVPPVVTPDTPAVVAPTEQPPVPETARRQVTPQVPSYISVPVGLVYYVTSVIDDLHKRLGELRHDQAQPDSTHPEMFLRYIGSNMTYKSNVGFEQFGYDFDMDYSALQLGGNLLRFDGEQDSLRGGLAYTYGNSRIRPKAADGFSSTTFDNNSLGLYLTWQRQNGFYMDGVLSFDRHRGDTDISRQSKVGSPKGKSWSASLESGYPYQFDNGLKIEPQAQLTYSQINMDSITDQDNTTVNYQHYNQTTGRLGVRTDRTWVDDKGRQYTPYVRVNYIKGWGAEAKTTIGAQHTQINHSFTSGKFGQSGELGVGGTATFKKDWSLYAEVDYRKELNSNGAKGWGYTGGVRRTF